MAALSMLALDSGFSQFRTHPDLDLEPGQVADHVTRVLLHGLCRRS